MKKTLFKSLLVIIILLAICFYYFFYPKLEVISAYAAKTACSSIYLSDRTLEDVLLNDLAATPLNLASVVLDHRLHSAKASVLGMQTKEAVYRKGFGCILIEDKDDYAISYPTSNYSKDSAKNVLLPGDNYNTINSEAVKYLFQEKNKTQALIVLKNDRILLEKYGPNINANTPLTGWSMTKSITSALIGIAIQEGLIKLKDTNLFEEWKNDERSAISVNDLLQMNSGLEWTEDYTRICEATKMLYMSGNIMPDLVSSKFESKKWEYSSGTTNLLMGLLRKRIANDELYWLYPSHKLFKPLGMASATIETDESGNFIGSSFGYATARDWAKFGQLYLNNGKLSNGAILIDSSFVSYSAKAVNNKTPQYGAQWWLNTNNCKYKSAPPDLYSANGYNGQHIWIIPSLDLVIVRIGLSAAFEKDYFLKLLLKDLSFT